MSEIIKVDAISSDVASDATTKAEQALMLARGVIISTDLQYTNAGVEMLSIKSFLKELEVERKKITDPIQKAKDAVMEFFNRPKNDATKAVEIIGKAMQDYQTKKEELARIENARLADIAKKEADKLAEKARKEAERGNHAKAEELKQQAAMRSVIVPIVTVEAPKIAGLTTRTNWSYEVVDINLVPREYMCVDDKKLGAVIRATKGTLLIPGIKAIMTEKISGSR
jgi:hypothetical protein